MLKLNTCVRSLVACSATILIAGSAAASSSNNDFLNFFDSIFDDDSNGGGGTAASLSIGDDDFFEATVVEGISVIETPQGTAPTPPEEDCRRVICPDTGDGGDPWPDGGNGGTHPPGHGGGGAHPVPEPTSAMLFGLGALVVARRVRR